ncbi:hypothetical protein [Halobacteriovorax marinus]|uniref:hypothetical protein n=1 Tax=Halobacteriovorax marinus TaxID=97084 RepID=UPI0012FEE371|nr:hypothetical protein [Halobacteriovorax marinus]
MINFLRSRDVFDEVYFSEFGKKAGITDYRNFINNISFEESLLAESDTLRVVWKKNSLLKDNFFKSYLNLLYKHGEVTNRPYQQVYFKIDQDLYNFDNQYPYWLLAYLKSSQFKKCILRHGDHSIVEALLRMISFMEISGAVGTTGTINTSSFDIPKTSEAMRMLTEMQNCIQLEFLAWGEKFSIKRIVGIKIDEHAVTLEPSYGEVVDFQIGRNSLNSLDNFLSVNSRRKFRCVRQLGSKKTFSQIKIQYLKKGIALYSTRYLSPQGMEFLKKVAEKCPGDVTFSLDTKAIFLGYEGIEKIVFGHFIKSSRGLYYISEISTSEREIVKSKKFNLRKFFLFSLFGILISFIVGLLRARKIHR